MPYSQMLIDILESRSMNTVALITMIISLYTVSRGIGNIYEISKNIYHQHMRNNCWVLYLYV